MRQVPHGDHVLECLGCQWPDRGAVVVELFPIGYPEHGTLDLVVFCGKYILSFFNVIVDKFKMSIRTDFNSDN